MAAARILIVDDEPDVVKLTSRALAARGYQVVGVTDPCQALEAVQHDPTPDLVISDVMMPGLSGPELIREIHGIHPKAATLLITGYAGGIELPAGVPVLFKPFTMDALFHKVEEVLARATEARAEIRREVEASQQLRLQSQELCEEAVRARVRAREACQRAKEALEGGGGSRRE